MSDTTKPVDLDHLASLVEAMTPELRELRARVAALEAGLREAFAARAIVCNCEGVPADGNKHEDACTMTTDLREALREACDLLDNYIIPGDNRYLREDEVRASELRAIADAAPWEQVLRFCAAASDAPKPVDLDQLAAVVEGLSEGPWSAEYRYLRIPGTDDALFDDSSDAAGIAALRNAAPALIAELRALRSARDADAARIESLAAEVVRLRARVVALEAGLRQVVTSLEEGARLAPPLARLQRGDAVDIDGTRHVVDMSLSDIVARLRSLLDGG